MPLVPITSCFALLLLSLAGCATPRSAAPAEPAEAPAACAVGDVPLARAAGAVDSAALVAAARVVRVTNASQFVQSPPPAVGDTVVFHATAEIEAVFRGAMPEGERVTFSFAAPLPADGPAAWEGQTWLLPLDPVRSRVPWTALHAPIPMTDAVRTRLGLADADATWPAPGTRFVPSVGIETVRGGKPEASGFVVEVKTEEGQRGSVRLTDMEAAEPALWVRPENSEVWQRVEPCSLAGARLLRALPSPEAVETADVEAYERLVTLLRGRLMH